MARMSCLTTGARRTAIQIAFALGLGLAGVAAMAAADVAVHFDIDMREATAAGRFDPSIDAVGVRGAAAPLSWQHSALAATSGGGIYTVTVRLADEWVEGAPPLAYKFKIERPGRPDEGWEDGPNRRLVLRGGDLRVTRVYGSGVAAPALQRTGRIDRIAPRASAFVQPREVQVWLPPGYVREPARRYPVLYLHDGQNVFDASGAGVEWGVDETAQRLVVTGAVVPMIIVAVANTSERMDEYTPVRALLPPAPAPVGGGAARYGRYLAEELKPLIDARYRTRPEAAATAVGGSSLGGLVSLWLVLHRPQTFGAALALSPTALWADFAIVDDVRTATLPSGAKPPRIWLDVGLREVPAMLEGARRLRDAIQARGWPLVYAEQPGAAHEEASWAARVEPMLRHLYGAAAGQRPAVAHHGASQP